MKINTIASFALVPLLLSACSSDGTNPFDPEAVIVQSGFATPSATGSFATTLDNPRGSVILTSTGNGYAYEVGAINASNTLVGRAGIVPATTVTAPLTMGTATLDGVYNVRTILNAQIAENVVTGDTLFQANVIQLTADFDNSTLKGDAAGLEVDGTFTGQALSGTVTFNGISGALTGVVGANEAVGAFQGNTSNGVMAGGFNVKEASGN